MKCLKISNEVEVEPNAFKLLGACTKRGDDTKIGYFGSGLKYAMAVFMRENVNLRIFAGEKEVLLGTVKDNFRGQEFDIITIDGEKTSLTTSMGVDWKLWHAVREVYCNAIDELNHELKIGTCEPIGEEGKTIFYIEITEELENIVADWKKYFSIDREYIYTCENGKIFPTYGGTMNIYRRGICCWDSTAPSLYDYDLPKVKINESRVVTSHWDISRGVANIWGKCADTKMLDQLVKIYANKEDKIYEMDLYWDSCWVEFNDTWIEYFEGRMLVPYEYAGNYEVFLKEPRSVILKHVLIRKLMEKFGSRITTCLNKTQCEYQYAPINPTKRIQFLLDECTRFLDEVGLKIPYKITVGIFTSNMVLGSITEKKDEIILSVKLFDLGKKRIVCTILEEWSHIESGEGDETRGFQDFLIGQIVTLLENQYGVFL